MKRFIETNRHAETWFVDLSVEMKAAYDYLWATCDNAGVWNGSTRMADTQIGKKIDWARFVEQCKGRVATLPNGALFLADFVRCQCGELRPDCRPHQAVVKLLQSHGLFDSEQYSILYPAKSGGYSIPPIQGQVQGSGQDKDQEEGVQGEAATARKDRCTREEVVAFCVELGLTEKDGESMFLNWQTNGWKVGSNPVKDWRAQVRNWKLKGFHPSQKAGNGTPGNISPARAAADAGRHYAEPTKAKLL